VIRGPSSSLRGYVVGYCPPLSQEAGIANRAGTKDIDIRRRSTAGLDGGRKTWWDAGTWDRRQIRVDERVNWKAGSSAKPQAMKPEGALSGRGIIFGRRERWSLASNSIKRNT